MPTASFNPAPRRTQLRVQCHVRACALPATVRPIHRRPRSSAPRNAAAQSRPPPTSRPILHVATLPAPFLALTSHIGLTSSTHQIDATHVGTALPSRGGVALGIDPAQKCPLKRTPSAVFVLAALGHPSLVRPTRDGERSLLASTPYLPRAPSIPDGIVLVLPLLYWYPRRPPLSPSPVATARRTWMWMWRFRRQHDRESRRDAGGGGDPAIPDVRCTAGRHVVVSCLIGSNFGTLARRRHP
ncbi:hypothetical protein B0H13DRAFT_1893162 [Mycena leptocephala]|nr:hypothetical protein B0H13DRAFT_1893162 [Mycena leptocephala]